MFNGSASLRDAAGSLIEEVVKGVRRKKTVDDAFIAALYDQTASQYHLDQIESAAHAEENGDQGMGPLPGTAVTLLAALAAAWALIGAFALARALKARKKAA